MSNEPLFLRDIGASCDGTHVSARLNDGEITIWGPDSPEPVARCKPGFSGGESRYQIDPSRGLIYSGTLEDGLTCFDYKAKKVIWRRKDIIGIQTVNISTALPDSVFLTLEAPDYRLSDPSVKSGIAELDAQTGKMKRISDIGDWLWVHSEKPVLVTTNRGGGKNVIRLYDADQKELGIIGMSNFAVMDAAFSGDRIALAEGAKGVRVIDVSGRTICSYSPQGRKPNCIVVAYHGEQICIHDSWEGAFVTTIDPVSGQVIAEHQRPRAGDICFIGDGSSYVDQTGAVFDALTGSQIGQLNPPKTSRFKVGRWLRKCLKP